MLVCPRLRSIYVSNKLESTLCWGVLSTNINTSTSQQSFLRGADNRPVGVSAILQFRLKHLLSEKTLEFTCCYFAIFYHVTVLFVLNAYMSRVSSSFLR